MTLPIFLAVHLAYGALMAHVLMRRMRAEGEVLGIPLVVTLLPVGLLSAPLGTVLLRYAGGWFLHGALTGDGSIPYERFHLGLMLLVGVLAAACTVGGMFAVIAAVSRDRVKLGLAPFAVAGVIALVTIIADGADIVHVRGTNGRWLFLHPAGLVSLGVVAVLVAAVLYARARTATVMPRPVAPAFSPQYITPRPFSVPRV